MDNEEKGKVTMLEEVEAFNQSLEDMFSALQTMINQVIFNPEAKIFSDNLLFLYLLQDKLKEVVGNLAIKVYYDRKPND